MKKINLFRIIFVLILITIAAFAILNPKKVETNLLRAFFANGAQDEVLVNLSGKYSSSINVLFESENLELLEKTKEDFEQKISPESFKIENFDYRNTLDFYKKHKSVLLSDTDYKLIKSGDYEKVSQKALNNLYDPFGFAILPVEEDPFMLLTDFLTGIGGTAGAQTSLKGKYYEILKLKADDNLALSPSLMNKEVKKLVELQKYYTNRELNVYLTGAPVHAYYASESSMNEINLICIISTIFVGLLVFFYFRSLKILLPVLTGLAAGMGTGYCVTSLLFDSIHILTFVFSTTLIGICVDYSLHYLMESDIKKIIKSLTVSMLSTVCALLMLAISGIEILKQMAVFTSAGLITVYFIVVLFYELLPPQKSRHIFNFKFSKIILAAVFLVIAAGLYKISFSDDIRDMYRPSKDMIYAERLYSQVANRDFDTSFIVVEGENLEKILEKEEETAKRLSSNNFSYYSLSKFIPSQSRQSANQALIKNLYDNKISAFSDYLTAAEINKLKVFEHPFTAEEGLQNIYAAQDFLIDKNHSIMIVYDFQSPEILKEISNIRCINLPLDISKRIKEVRLVCLWILAPIFLGLYIILGCIFSFKNAHKIILPSVLASLFAIGAVSLSGDVNLFHVLAIFLITGFGLDYSVFRFNGSKNSNDAVFISCLTTVVSFSLLALTSFKLISSLGFVLAVGLLSSYILSIVLISKDSGEATESIN